jgi:hypothetical protein
MVLVKYHAFSKMCSDELGVVFFAARSSALFIYTFN